LIIDALDSTIDKRLAERLATSGLRMTRQREQVFNVALKSHDHPTADDIYQRTKVEMRDISFATVYNCLSVLVECGLLRQVTLDRAPARFCPNMNEHSHFFCEGCGGVTDVRPPDEDALRKLGVPEGSRVSHYDLSVRGFCPACARA
jgi:Fe2+ or Zn2+ uptake regulation protein